MKKFSFVIIAVLFSAMNVCAQSLGTKQVKNNVTKQMEFQWLALDLDMNGEFSDYEMLDAKGGKLKLYYDYSNKKMTLDYNINLQDGSNSGNIHCEAEGIELMTFTKNGGTYYNFLRQNGDKIASVCVKSGNNSLILFDVLITKSFEKQNK